MSANTSVRILLAFSLSMVVPAGRAFAGRGGGGGGGGHAGGGGGMSHPSFSAPRSNISGCCASRPSMPSCGNVARPSMGNNANINSPNFNNNANINRPNVNNNANINRPNVNNNANINRPNVNNNTVVNKPNVNNNTVVNRPNVNNNTVVNRPNINNNTIVNRPINTGNSFNNRPINVNNANFNSNYARINQGNWNNNNGRGGYPNGGWPGRNPYWGYHQGWVNGSWNYHNYPNYNLGYFGLGFGAGLATFGLGSALYNWGYSGYSNPYYYGAGAGYGYAPSTTVVVQQPGVGQQGLAAQQPGYYNYAQPINSMSAAPDPTTSETALAGFDRARELFKAGDYTGALAQTDSALITLPNDPTLHEFRALVLFAQKRYDDSAAVLYAVLSAGPGWDWTTMVGLYPDVETYTAQLRALEDDSRANPDKASDHFVLAYQYLTQGFPDNATTELRDVARLQPKDPLANKMLALLVKPAPGGNDAAAPPPPGQATPPANPSAVQGTLAGGSWSAKPTADVNITLKIIADGSFTWTVADKSGPRKLTGNSTFGNDVLTLAPSTGEPLVGKITWTDATHFTFQAGGGGPSDPGLTFEKTSS